MEKLTLTVKEAADLSGIGERSIYELCRTGEIPCRRIGQKHGRILISRKGLIEWIDKEENHE